MLIISHTSIGINNARFCLWEREEKKRLVEAEEKVFYIREYAFTGSSYVCTMSVIVPSLDPEDLTYASTMKA